MIRLVGLDLDGTLVDSAPDLSDALGRALESLALPSPTLEQTRSWIGDGIETLIGRAIADATGRSAEPGEIIAALRAFDERYASHHFIRSRLYPGVAETLGQIRAAGIATVCITNKRLAFAEALLAAAGLDRYLDAVYGGDSCPRKKPAPDQLSTAAQRAGVPSEFAAMVGDSPNDFDAATAAGWKFVWASYGYTAGITERGLAPTIRIDEFTALPGLLSQL